MREVRIFAAVAILLILVPGFLHGAIPASERAALIALYNAADGDNWWSSYGWKTPPLEPDGFAAIGSEGTWEGIYVSNDHVVEIFLGAYERQQNKKSGSVAPTIAPEVGTLVYLTSLDIFDLDLTGGIPSELGNLRQLIHLGLSSNCLTGSIPPELGELENLKYLVLDCNQLSGTIPPELGKLGNLKRLLLGGNQLTGMIPPELGNLAKLELLGLKNNQLTGVPPELGELANLKYLVLDCNQLSGTIPPELGKLSLLIMLHLNNNQLTGGIPKELGNLENLSKLELSDNQLTGNIPPELENMVELDHLILRGNQLSGNIPSNIAKMNDLRWPDIGYNGLYATDEILREFLNDRQEDWELTQTIAPTEISAVPTSSSAVTISWNPILYTGGTGAYYIYYSTAPGGTRIFAGKTADKTVSSYTVSGLTPGTAYYFVVRTQTEPHANNANTVTSEESEEKAFAIGSIGPFGSFDTPVTGSTVCSSIPVTGWALDDFGVAHVKIYRQEDGSEKLVYIGDADFVEGARPDIELAYPSYPDNQRAGWGYMMLTNFLPNGGNGTFTLHSVAVDIEGNQTTLGTKTIVCDNANAVKPFGAIDTPTQGGTASGSNSRNQGWVLTPMPNKVPVDGSTINVYVDGVYQGHPLYDRYRQDILALFPGYANSSGAGAYFDFDTTIYSNGVHTIYWTAEDDAGNADGIGSRYFVIQNTGRRGNPMWLPASSRLPGLPDISNIPTDYWSPVGLITGCNRDAEPRVIYPDDSDIITVAIKELGRVEMFVGAWHAVPLHRKSIPPVEWTGFHIVGNQLKRLPIGSTLDTERGIFYWSPGPGFIGSYRLVFLGKQQNGEIRKTMVEVRIQQKGY